MWIRTSRLSMKNSLCVVNEENPASCHLEVVSAEERALEALELADFEGERCDLVVRDVQLLELC